MKIDTFSGSTFTLNNWSTKCYLNSFIIEDIYGIKVWKRILSSMLLSGLFSNILYYIIFKQYLGRLMLRGGGSECFLWDSRKAMFKTLDDAWFWLLILTLNFDTWFWNWWTDNANPRDASQLKSLLKYQKNVPPRSTKSTLKLIIH